MNYLIFLELYGLEKPKSLHMELLSEHIPFGQVKLTVYPDPYIDVS